MQPYDRQLAHDANITDLLLECDSDEVIALAMLAGADLEGTQQTGWRCHPNAMMRLKRDRAAMDYLIGCDIPLPERVTP